MLSEGAKEHLQPKKHLCSSLTGAHKKDVLLLGFRLFGFWPYISLHKGKNSKWDAVHETFIPGLLLGRCTAHCLGTRGIWSGE